MAELNAFSKNQLNGNIYPLSYTVALKYDIDILYFTAASVEDAYDFIRDKLNDYLYIFDVGHYMVKDGIYLTLKEILENDKIDADHIYEDDIIAIRKEKFRKFLKFPQYSFKMFDHDRLMTDEGFYDIYKPAVDRLKNLDVFMDIGSRMPKYFINCRDNSLLYCETADRSLKFELLKKMLRDYLRAFLDKKNETGRDIAPPPQEFVEELFDKWDKITIREDSTGLKNNNITASVFDVENRETGILTYKTDKKEWLIKEA
jgi:hypothetical protein